MGCFFPSLSLLEDSLPSDRKFISPLGQSQGRRKWNQARPDAGMGPRALLWSGVDSSIMPNFEPHLVYVVVKGEPGSERRGSKSSIYQGGRGSRDFLHFHH
jgi:hypothetical protein